MIIQVPHFEVLRIGMVGYRTGMSRVTKPMRYNWISKNTLIEVPEGTLTDFASIPRGFRNVFSVNDNHRLPALLHDYLYHERGRLKCGTKYSRKEADEEFYNAMIMEGVGFTTAKMMYWAVRMFGRFYTDFTGEKKS